MKNIITLLSLAALLTVGSCKKETTTNTNNNTSLPGGATVTTTGAIDVTTTSATLGGNITNEGACTVLSSGVVLATTTAPTTSNITIPNITTTGIGSFSVSATGLLPATTYYARAYAINCKGLNYGNEIQFTTLGGGGGGGGGKDTTYYVRLNFKGVTYVCAGAGSDSIVEADGRRSATCAVSGGVFVLAASATNYVDDSKSNGFSFGVTCTGITAPGPYTFTEATADPKSFGMGLRFASGMPNPMAGTVLVWNNALNQSRYKNASGDCIDSDITIATQTLTITQWGNNAGDVIAGTFSGTIYENGKSAFDCVNSDTQLFTGSFKLKRF